MSPGPFDRPADRALEQLRRLCGPDPYRLISGEPDGWLARCPLHPSSRPTLLVVDRGDHRRPRLRCRLGCPPAVLARLLDPELQADLDERAQAAAAVLLWAQRLGRNGDLAA